MTRKRFLGSEVNPDIQSSEVTLDQIIIPVDNKKR